MKKLLFLINFLILNACGQIQKENRRDFVIQQQPAPTSPQQGENTDTLDAQAQGSCDQRKKIKDPHFMDVDLKERFFASNMTFCDAWQKYGKKNIIFQMIPLDCADCFESIAHVQNFLKIHHALQQFEHIAVIPSKQSDLQHPFEIDVQEKLRQKFLRSKVVSKQAAFIAFFPSGQVYVSQASEKYLEDIAKIIDYAEEDVVPKDQDQILIEMKQKWNANGAAVNQPFSIISIK